MLNLIYNEIEKQVKKLSFKICLIILLLVAISFPILFKTNSLENGSIYTKEDLEYYENKIVKDPKSDQEKLTNELDSTMINIINLVIKDKKLNTQTEFNSEIIQLYTEDLLTSKALNYITKNKKINYKSIDNLYSLNTSLYLDYKPEELNLIKEEINKKCQEDLKTINEKDYPKYLKQEIERLQTLEKDETTNEKIKLYKKYIELNIKDSSDFRINEGNKILENLSQKEKILNENEFTKIYKNMTYKTYLKITKEKNKEIDNDIKKSWYSIENNINYNKNNLKTNFEDSISNNQIILGIIMIIISGSIVSSEFQKGTIRLLVTKPSKRWKILLSKFLAITIITIGLLLLTNLLSLITNGIIYGFKDYFTPFLKITSGKVKEICYLTHILGVLLINLIPIIFINLIAFSLGTITHNTALSVGITIFIQLSYSLLIILLIELGINAIDLTFLPYLDYSQFLDKKLLYDNNIFYEKYYDINKANLVLLSWSILIYSISNLIFVKKDIKN